MEHSIVNLCVGVCVCMLPHDLGEYFALLLDESTIDKYSCLWEIACLNNSFTPGWFYALCNIFNCATLYASETVCIQNGNHIILY